MDKNAVAGKPKVAREQLKKPEKQSVVIRWIGGIDIPFFCLLLVLVALGTIMVFTASYSYASTKYNDSYYFSKKQILWLAMGIAAMFVVINFKWFNYRTIRKFAYIIFIVAVVLNVAVIAKGYISNGAKRWIEIGPISFQPSEILKFAIVISLARFISKNQDKIRKPMYSLLPFLVVAIVSCGILLLQSHLSATIIALALSFLMMFLGGASLWWMAPLGMVGFGAAFYVVTNIDTIVNWSFVKEHLGHIYNRLLVWSDPFAYMRDEASGWAGWQPSQSLYAISSGGIWGVGLGQSMQKHGFLPEPQNDYIFAILCEEFGFIGAVTVIALFAALIIRGFIIARNCKDRFCQLVVEGLMIKLGLQVFLNIAVVTNILPSTGISLPFFSYGGTALIMALMEMGIVLSISKYSYTERGDA